MVKTVKWHKNDTAAKWRNGKNGGAVAIMQMVKAVKQKTKANGKIEKAAEWEMRTR